MTTTTDPDFGVREALRLIGSDPENWVSDRPGIDHNFTIVGGSGSGCVFAFALRRAGIGRVTVIDPQTLKTHCTPPQFGNSQLRLSLAESATHFI